MYVVVNTHVTSFNLFRSFFLLYKLAVGVAQKGKFII